MNYSIPARLSEPSTYAGLAAVAVAIGQAFPALSPYANILTLVLGAVGAALKERGSPS